MRPPMPQAIIPIPEGLAPRSARLVRDFAAALAAKLRAAEEKYGYRDGWSTQEWEVECRQKLQEHIAKGDPRDVAIYCAFMWARGWSTTEPRAYKQELEGWKEAAIAWSVCASIHREYGKGKDPFYKTRQADFTKHENDARARLTA